MARYVPGETGKHYFEATTKDGTSWFTCSRCVDVEREALRVCVELPFLLPVRVWSVYEKQDGLSRYRIQGPWENTD
jgi:hypothetical protein